MLLSRALAVDRIDWPGLLVVVGRDGCGRPEVAIARDFPIVVEIVEHGELQRALVMVGRDTCAIQSQGKIAVAHPQVAQHLVVGAVLLYDLDDMFDGRGALSKANSNGIAPEQIVPLDAVGEFSKLTERLRNPEPCHGSNKQARSIGRFLVSALPIELASAVWNTDYDG